MPTGGAVRTPEVSDVKPRLALDDLGLNTMPTMTKADPSPNQATEPPEHPNHSAAILFDNRSQGARGRRGQLYSKAAQSHAEHVRLRFEGDQQSEPIPRRVWPRGALPKHHHGVPYPRSIWCTTSHSGATHPPPQQSNRTDWTSAMRESSRGRPTDFERIEAPPPVRLRLLALQQWDGLC